MMRGLVHNLFALAHLPLTVAERILLKRCGAQDPFKPGDRCILPVDHPGQHGRASAGGFDIVWWLR